MSAALGIPVVPISAAKGEGVSELITQALTVARGKILPKVTDFCTDDSRRPPLPARRYPPHLRITPNGWASPTPVSAPPSSLRAAIRWSRTCGWMKTKRSCWDTASSRWKTKPAGPQCRPGRYALYLHRRGRRRLGHQVPRKPRARPLRPVRSILPAGTPPFPPFGGHVSHLLPHLPCHRPASFRSPGRRH